MSRGTHTKSSQSGCPRNFAHVKNFSILAPDDNESPGECCASKHMSRIHCQQRRCGGKRADEYITAPETKFSSHRGSGRSKLNAHQVSYLPASGGDSKGVHHVSGFGWRRLSPMMDSGSAECVALESNAKSIPWVETEGSRQGQTHHSADGGVIKNKGEKTVTMFSVDGDQFRARYQITDVARRLFSVSRVCDQGNSVFFTQTGDWIINHKTGRKTWFIRAYGVYVLHSWINGFPTQRCVRWPGKPFPGQECYDSVFPRTRGISGLCKTVLEDSRESD